MKDVLGYAGKRVIVTGAASGIGAATTELLVELGAEVHAIDVTKPELTGLASYTECDLSDPAQIEAAANRIGRVVNMLFHCGEVGAGDVTAAMVPLMSAGGAIVIVSDGSSHAETATPDPTIRVEHVRIESTAASLEEQARAVLNAGRRAD